jgi:hypothetical protein
MTAYGTPRSSSPVHVYHAISFQSFFLHIHVYWDEPPEMVMTWPIKLLANWSSGKINLREYTVDPATVLRGEESDHASDVLWQSAALERAVVGHQLLDLVRGPVWSAARDVVPDTD